jgi:hypothetical protein
MRQAAWPPPPLGFLQFADAGADGGDALTDLNASRGPAF